jgi:hypothetical protein
LRPASVDAVVSFYALIHVPLADQQALFPRIRGWLHNGGHFLATVGANRWTGTEDYLGAPMFWDHADTGTYLRWLQAAGMTRSGTASFPKAIQDTPWSWREPYSLSIAPHRWPECALARVAAGESLTPFFSFT